MASSLNPTHLLSVTWRLFECLDDKRGCRGDHGNFSLPILHSELHGYPETIPVLLGLFGNVFPNFFRRKTKRADFGASEDAAPTSPPVARRKTSMTEEGSNLGGILR